MHNISYDALRNMRSCLRVGGDLVLLSDPKFFLPDENLLKPGTILWKKGFSSDLLPEYLRPKSWEKPIYALSGLLNTLPDELSEYLAENGHRPAWYGFCTDQLKKYINYIAAMTEIEPVAIEPNYIPYVTDNGYIIEEGGLAENVIDSLGLIRLKGIKMWGNLCDAGTENEGQTAASFRFPHTRFSHSLDTFVGGRIVAYNHRHLFSQEDLDLLDVLHLSHDGMTPAGGDGTIAVDPRLNENLAYPRFFKFPTWPRLKELYRLDEQKLFEAICGKNWRGKLLKLVDRIFYVGRDTDVILRRYGKTWPLDERDLKFKILDLALRYPDICRICEDIKISPNFEVYLANPDKFHNFLLLKTYLGLGVYYSPGNRNLESIMSATSIPYLLRETRQIDFDFLFREQDCNLEIIIAKFLGIPYKIDNSYQLGTPRWATFRRFDDALDRANKLFRQGIVFIAIEDLTGKIKNDVDTLVDDCSGKILPFSVVLPKKAAEIEELASLQEPIILHWVEDPKIDGKALEKLRAFKKKELKKRSNKK